jgi:hypothetical protein
MNKYIYLKAIYLSFFSKDLYRNVLQNWKGLGLKYLLMLSFFAALIMSANLLRVLNSFDTEEMADEVTSRLFEKPDLTFEQNLNRVLDVASQVPSLMVKNSELSISEKEPYFIKDPISGKDWIIFDTTGGYTSLEGTDAFLLVTKTSLISKNEKGFEEENYLSKNLQTKDEKNVNDFFYLISQIPKITIKDGIASIAETSPYFVKDKDENIYLAIDTNDEPDLEQTEKAFVTITKDKVLYKDFLNTEKDAKMKEVLISQINADLIYSGMESLAVKMRSLLNWSIPLLGLPLIALATFIPLLITVLIYGVITLILSKILKLENLDYEHAIRLSAVAVTPVFIAKSVLPVFLPSQSVIYFIVSLFYLHFAVSANLNNPKNNNV